MAFAVAAITAGGVLGGLTLYNGYQQNKANQDARSAQRQALEMARKQADQADQANNKANAKMPNIAALLAGNQAPGGIGSTMLTGPGGIDPTKLTLGRNTLLGT